MKKLMLGLVGVSLLSGCAINQPLNTVAGQNKDVEFIPSFILEVAPQKVACELKNYAGEVVMGKCLEVRSQKTGETMVLKSNIKGFTHVEGTSYVLDVRQVSTPRQDYQFKQSTWVLNNIITQSQ